MFWQDRHSKSIKTVEEKYIFFVLQKGLETTDQSNNSEQQPEREFKIPFPTKRIQSFLEEMGDSRFRNMKEEPSISCYIR